MNLHLFYSLYISGGRKEFSAEGARSFWEENGLQGEFPGELFK